MPKLKTYTEFINEGFIDAIKNPFKWSKIKNNAKKLQKAKVAHALNDVDYAKKLSASASKKESDVLKKTKVVKAAALKDIETNVSTRMDDLATTDGLKAVVKLAKITSNLAANKIIIKSATGEEAKQLKIKQKVLVDKVGKAKSALSDYESNETPEEQKTREDKEAKEKKEVKDTKNKGDIKEIQTEIDSAKKKYDSIDPKDEVAKIDAEIAYKQAQQKKATLEDNKELVQGLGTDIGELMKKKQPLVSSKPKTDADKPKTDVDKPESVADKPESDPVEDKIAHLEDNIRTQDKIQSDASSLITSLTGDLKSAKAGDIDSIKDKIQQASEDRKAAKSTEDKLKKELKPIADKQYGESYVPLVESVSDKFKRLRVNL